MLILLVLLWPAAWARAADEVLAEDGARQPAPGRALAVLVNSGAKSIDVFLDQGPVGVFDAKTYAVLQAEPGARVLWGSMEGQTFTLEEGKIYTLTFNGASWNRLTWKLVADGMVPAGFRYARSAAEQRKILTGRLEAGEYASALRALGKFPVHFGHVSCGKHLSNLLPVPRSLYKGVLTVDEARITYLDGDRKTEIPVDGIQRLQAIPPGANTPDATIRIEYGPKEDPLKLSCTVSFKDFPEVRRALGMVRERSLAKTGTPAAGEASSAETAAGSPVERATRLAAALDSQEEALLRPPPGEDPKKTEERRKQPFDPAQVRQLPALIGELESWLAGHPEDREALMLAARLGRLQELTWRPAPGAGMVEAAAAVAESRARLAHVQELLDRLLGLEPGSAAAYTLKARTYGLPRLERVNERFRYQPGDFERAAEAAGKAMRLQPGNVEAALLFARYLTAIDKPMGEMVSTAREVAGENHAITRLLSDFASFPVPEGSVALPRGSRVFGGLIKNKSGDGDPFAELRGRVYAVPGSIRTVLASYKQQWPGTEFFDLEKGPFPNFPGRIMAQSFVWTDQGLQPTGNKEGVFLLDGEGIFVFLNEAKAMGGDDVASALLGVPESLKTPYILLWVMSRRNLGTGD